MTSFLFKKIIVNPVLLDMRSDLNYQANKQVWGSKFSILYCVHVRDVEKRSSRLPLKSASWVQAPNQESRIAKKESPKN